MKVKCVKKRNRKRRRKGTNGKWERKEGMKRQEG